MACLPRKSRHPNVHTFVAFVDANRVFIESAARKKRRRPLVLTRKGGTIECVKRAAPRGGTIHFDT
jgi:hypothetical protein